MATVQLDTDGLDAEDLKALAEVSKKGYYHGRPKSNSECTPKRVDDASLSPPSGSSTGSVKRTEFDAYQKKWDSFSDDKFLATVERDSMNRS
mmetsp:Transcript_8677/g.15632  ORF Transcript_8677/g.15632 Transcript_8677/m.15632 type:complete len:92 (+) Transcript_8677:99-374(+)